MASTLVTCAGCLRAWGSDGAVGAATRPDGIGSLPFEPPAHSHSIVPGGLLVTSRTTRLTSSTSLVMRVEMDASTS